MRNASLGVLVAVACLAASPALAESFAGRQAYKLDAARVKVLTDFVEASRQALGVPGISVGIVQDGKTVFAGGFGVRAVGRPDKVDADTLYLVASNTKPLTTLMLAKLVDEGKLTWETPVADLEPRFRLADAATTPKIQVKHLLCACTGLPYRNLDWEVAPPNAPETLAFDILARMRPAGTFGATYSYSNPIAAAGGFVGGRVAYPDLALGAAYDKAMDTRVFGPLGMSRTTFDYDTAMQGNFARAYGVNPLGERVEVDPARNRQMHAVRPTGGAWTNVNDLLAYVRMELAGGRLGDGTRYISEAALKARSDAQVSTGAQSWYGMGLDTNVSSGTTVRYHGGRLYGFRGDTVWLPEHDVGVVILANASTANVLMEALPRKLMEVLFDGEPKADGMVAAAAAAENQRREAARQAVRYPADGSGLAPRYRNDVLGELKVASADGQTVFEFSAWKTPVASRTMPDGAAAFVVMAASPTFPFVAGKTGERRTLTIREGQNAFTFVEVD
ncbi:serine hydrolase domain-containing protein [Caulobacter sp.]|uniref:serine hydrolase n=1 Tax=Caulobacter sp. TaxID=78 RepID=UPI00161EC118